MEELPLGTLQLCSSAMGKQIPNWFAKFTPRTRLEGVDDSDLDVLLVGPDHEAYWEAWDDILDLCVLTDQKGNQFTLWENKAGLWAVPLDYGWGEV